MGRVGEKVPIDEHGEGNCCPECGSKKITRHQQRNLHVDVNLLTQKAFTIQNGKMRPLSARDKVCMFDNADMIGGGGCWSFGCRKCGWISETFAE